MSNKYDYLTKLPDDKLVIAIIKKLSTDEVREALSEFEKEKEK